MLPTPHVPAHPQHDLLPEALLRVCGVQAMGDRLVRGLIGFEIGVQQIQAAPGRRSPARR